MMINCCCRTGKHHIMILILTRFAILTISCAILNKYTSGPPTTGVAEGFLVFFIISALFVNIALFYINTQRMKIIQKQIRTLTDMDQANDIQEGDLREIVSTSRQNSKIPDDLKTNS